MASWVDPSAFRIKYECGNTTPPCKIAGTGPECFKSSQYFPDDKPNYSKEQCLRDLEENREKAYENCIKDCRDSYEAASEGKKFTQKFTEKEGEKPPPVHAAKVCGIGSHWLTWNEDSPVATEVIWFLRYEDQPPFTPGSEPPGIQQCYYKMIQRGYTEFEVTCLGAQPDYGRSWPNLFLDEGDIIAGGYTREQLQTWVDDLLLTGCKWGEDLPATPYTYCDVNCWTGGETAADSAMFWFDCRKECANEITQWESTHCYCNQLECDAGRIRPPEGLGGSEEPKKREKLFESADCSNAPQEKIKELVPAIDTSAVIGFYGRPNPYLEGIGEFFAEQREAMASMRAPLSSFFGSYSFSQTPAGLGTNPEAAETKLPDIIVDEVPEPEADPCSKRSITTQASYDLPIERIYSRQYLNGNIIWLGEVTQETRLVKTQRKDEANNTIIDVTTEVVEFYLDFAMGIGTEIDGVTRIWIDDILIYDKSSSASIDQNQSNLKVTFISGRESQNPPDFMTVNVPLGESPAYRGVSMLLLEKFRITEYDGGMPEFRIEAWRGIEDDTTVSQASAVQTLSTDLFHFDTEANRLFMSLAAGSIRIMNTSTMATVRDLSLTGSPGATLAVSSLSHLVGQSNTGNTRIYDPVHGDPYGTVTLPIVHTTGELAIIKSARPTGVDQQYLCLSTSAGDIYFYELDDMKASFSFPSLWTFTAAFGGKVDFFSQMRYETAHSQYNTYDITASAIFAFRANGNTIDIKAFTTSSADQFVTLLEDGGSKTFTLPVATLGGTVSILGVYVCENTQAFILFLTVGGEPKIICWQPKTNSILWSVDTVELPNFRSNQIAVRGDFEFIKFVSPDGNIYKLTIEDGTVDELEAAPVAINSTHQGQFYNPYYDELIYVDSAGAIRKLNFDRIVGAADTLGFAVSEICELCGLDGSTFTADALNTVAISGYRTGQLLQANDILRELAIVYPFTQYTDRRLTFILKGTTTEFEVDEDYFEDPIEKRREYVSETEDSVILKYNSDSNDGVETEQHFSLPHVEKVGEPTTVVLNVVEDDTYMRQLAELYVMLRHETDVSGKITLPPRYIGVVPGADSIPIDILYRVIGVNVGADLSLEVFLLQDSAEKYNELVSITGTGGFEPISDTGTVGRIPLSEPLLFEHRPIAPSTEYRGPTVAVTHEDLTGAFSANAIVVARNDGAEVGSGFLTQPSTKLAWGRLLTVPTAVTTNLFTTQTDGTFQVKFFSSEMASRLSSCTFDQLKEDDTRNLLIVGNEAIQFKDVSIAGDGVTATFTTLLRYRWCTDDADDHTVGEAVYYWQDDAIDEAHLYQTQTFFKAATSSVVGRADRLRGVSATNFASRPTPINGKLQHIEAPVSEQQGAYTHYVVVTWDMRMPSKNYFTDTLTLPNFSALHSDCTIYLLRDDYDEDLFEEHLANIPPEVLAADYFPTWNSDTSYIIRISKAADQVPNVSHLNAFADIGTVTQGFIFHPDEQDYSNYERLTEKLCAVIVSTDSDYKNISDRYVVCWDAGADYETAAVQGIWTKL